GCFCKLESRLLTPDIDSQNVHLGTDAHYTNSDEKSSTFVEGGSADDRNWEELTDGPEMSRAFALHLRLM
ncbi:MAG: hypothetical protein AAF742_03345, partial [Pseudomonadota bacterium]